MIYCFSDIEWNRPFFLSFQTVFCPFRVVKGQKTVQNDKKFVCCILYLKNHIYGKNQKYAKSKFCKTEKSPRRYHHFTIVYQKLRQCMADVIVISHFGLFFALLPPNSPKKQNFEKTKKKPGDIIILHMCTKNYDQMTYNS